MVLVLFFALLLLFGCTQVDRDNPLDPDGVNFVGASGGDGSSSSVTASSSSDGGESSSSDAPLPKYTLEISIDAAEGGTVSRYPELELYEQGTVVTVKATAKAGYAFIGWSGALESESREWYIIMNGNKTLTANFELIPPGSYELAILIDDPQGGEVSRDPEGTIHVDGTKVTLTATPKFGYKFTGWSGAKTGTTNPIEITMDGHKELTANFVALPSGTFTDERDGQSYGWVRIGNQVWMAKNLNYNVTGSKCVGTSGVSGTLVDNGGRCETYGRLYNWATAMNIDSKYNNSYLEVSGNHHGVCPQGWHIPSDAEWDVLVKYVDPNWKSHTDNVAGTKLKAASGWNSGGNGTDNYGFSALPSGSGNSGSFDFVGNGGGWWSAMENELVSTGAYYRSVYHSHSYVSRNLSDKTYLYSVRCLLD